MTVLPALGLFLGFALVASFTPGPAVMLAVHNAMHFGWRRAVWSSLGNISGLLVLSSLSALGINAVLQSSASAFGLMKTVGAAYLIWLGVQQWRRAAVAPGAAAVDDPAAATDPALPRATASRRVLYRRGLGVALTNPKAIAFVAALFPQFLRAGEPMAPQYLLLTTTFMAVSLFALSCYAGLAVLARRPLRRYFAAGWPQRMGAMVFCGFGLALLRLHRR